MSLQPGIFTKIFARPRLEDALAAAQAHGLAQMQFNLSCAGLPSLPDEISRQTLDWIRGTFSQYGMRMAALSGTYNMIDPDLRKRAEGLRRLGVLIEACAGLGTGIITLCTGTRDPENMWRAHPANGDASAWSDLVEALEAVLPLAEARGVLLAFEPEPANVVNRAAKGRLLIHQMRSPCLKVVMDAANLFHPGELDLMPEVFHEAFDLLGSDIVLAHAKDLDAGGAVVAAGKGVLDYALYTRLLAHSGYTGPLILHSLDESEVAGSLAYLRSCIK